MIFILTCEQRLHTSNKKVGTRPINPRKNTNSGRNQIITNTKLHVWDTAQLSRVNLQSLNIARTEWKCNRIACKHMKTRKCCHAFGNGLVFIQSFSTYIQRFIGTFCGLKAGHSRPFSTKDL